KFDKVGKKGVAEELEKRGISKTAREKLTGLLGIEGGSEKVLDELGKALPDSEGVRQIKELLVHLSDLQVPSHRISVELYLARGLDYYTGPIFESVVEQPQIGSLTGGGRYDRLIGIFLGRDIPATGTSIGLERIIDVMQEYKLLEETGGEGGVLVTVFNPETRSDSLRIGTELRDRGVKTQIFLGDKDSLRDQIGYANSRQIRFVVIIGPAEAKSGQALVKDLKTGGQETYSQTELAEKSAEIFSD
ncbi:MAG: ATP phosphoribosyltransferase regulatory subunit, partial [candidate division Zixibacteria bacterium]|nr:ATP phosphoribosyltransferase regulatory subunit [candidate division Zixibacteria bacterium]